MDTVALSVQARDAEKAAKQLRNEDIVPCVLYGNDVENSSFQCDHNELFKAYAKAGESTIVDLDANGKKVPVLFHSIDFHPVSDKIMHVDFYAVDMKKEIEAQVPVHFIGEAPAVKDLGGVLLTVIDHVAVRCLPANLPHSLDVDISKLETFADSLHISDIVVTGDVSIQADEEQVIATVQEPRRAEPEPTEEGGEEGEEGAAEGEGGEGDAGGEAAEGGDE